MVPIALEYGQCTLEAPYMSSMSYNNGVEIVFKGKNPRNHPPLTLQVAWVV